MTNKICEKCGEHPALLTRPICRKCLNWETGEKRRQRNDFLRSQSSPKCPDCGVAKSDENCWRVKSGANVGKFTTYCKPCSNLRRVEWDNQNLPKEGDIGYEDFVARRKEYNSSLRRLPSYEEKAKRIEKNRMASRRSLNSRLGFVLSSAKSRAKDKNLEFDLDLDFLKRLAESNNNRCVLTDLEFCLEPPKKGFRVNPKAPSIDRIDSKKGYTKDNVRLVLTCVNIALSNFGQDFLTEWAIAYVEKLDAQLRLTMIEKLNRISRL